MAAVHAMITYCNFCGIEQENQYYKYCNIECQRNYWLFIENRIKRMNHAFESSKSGDHKLCMICSRDQISHTGIALCERCGKRDNCDIFGNELLCQKCFNSTISTEQSEVVEIKEEINDVIRQNAEVLKSIEYNGDFFNSAAIALMEVKKAIYATSTNAEREWQQQLVFNITHLRERIFKKNEEIARDNNELLANEKELRALGDKLHQEFRDKLRESDSLYRPQVSSAKPKTNVKKTSQTPYDRMIEIIMVNKNVSRQDAERIFIEAQRSVNNPPKA